MKILSELLSPPRLWRKWRGWWLKLMLCVYLYHTFRRCLTCNTSGIAIGCVSSQENHPVAYFNEKLNDARQWYSIYVKEFYAVMHALRYWRNFLLSQEFCVVFGSWGVKVPQLQKRLNTRHSKWVEFLQDYTFVLTYKVRVENKIADVLSRRVIILIAMSSEVSRFKRLREDYESCPNFREIFITLWDDFVREIDRFLLLYRYLFRLCKLCIPRTSLRDFLFWEMHAGGLTGHFGQNKTNEVVEHGFYSPSLKRDVAKIVGQCRTCQLTKQHK